MPRLSLYRPEKGNDYKFIDKTVWEMFQVGGTDVLVHKYLGPGASVQGISPSTPEYTTADPFHIQDLLFLENRDRKYDPDIYQLRGVYNLQDIDFNLSQFGLFLQNDTVFITFHINDTVEKLGRKIISGDVIELPHLKDEYALNDLQFALKRFYVVEEVNRAAEGFSVTWYPHLYRAKCKPLVDSQEFKDILDQVQADANGDLTNTTLRDIVSTYEKEMQITQAVLDQAEADVPKSGLDNTRFYTVQKDLITGETTLVSADNTTLNASLQTQATDENGMPLYETDLNGSFILDTYGQKIPIYVGSTASTMLRTPEYDDYPSGYLTSDGLPPNGTSFTAGISFPLAPAEGQFCLRTDYFPNRLFRWNNKRWVKFEDNVRMTMSNLGPSDTESGNRFEGKDDRQTQKGGFINNPTTSVINNKVVKQKQSLSKALRPKADE
jgi:hypothetical protein